MARSKTRKKAARRPAVADQLRIIGGTFRGRKLSYHPWVGTRPMKQRVREATFDLLGPAVRGKHAVDLFAGTGALGLEALSRGAVSATFIEQHVPTAARIRQNVAMLDVEARAEVLATSVFLWAERLKRPPTVTSERPPTVAWVVFCCPPYDFYRSRHAAMRRLITGLIAGSPDDSILAVEADMDFDFADLPRAEQWDVRSYRPAQLGILTL